MTRTDVPTAWDERTTLQTLLDYTRATVRAKCEGLAPDQSGRAPLPSSPLTSIGGIVSHLRWVEHAWIECRLLGAPDEGPWTEDEPDREFSLGATRPLDVLLDEYDAQTRRCDELIADLDLDTRSVESSSSGDHVTLRWILLHLIEETARHNGHLDILREMADGTTGDSRWEATVVAVRT